MSDATETTLIGLGTLGGLAAFAGCFVQFFQTTPGSLVNPGVGRPGWYLLVPIFVGLGTLGMFTPRRWRNAFGALPLAAVAMALGKATGFGFASSSGLGFYLIALGGLVLTLVWFVFFVAPARGLDEDRKRPTGR